MNINLDNLDMVPKKLPWEVQFLNHGRFKRNPKAITVGLSEYLKKEIEISNISPKKATKILDRIGIWFLYEKGTINKTTILKIKNNFFKIKINRNRYKITTIDKDQAT